MEDIILPKDHISISQINMYRRCPAQYYFRYIKGLKLPPKSYLARGRAIHKGQEYNYRQKIESFADLKTSEVQEVVANEFDIIKPEIEWDKDEKPSDILDQTINLATMYHKEIAPTVQPILVEQRIDVTFDNLPFFLWTELDLVDQSFLIRDTKSYSRTPSQKDVDNDIQLTGYSLAFRTIYGMPERGVALDCLIALKTPKTITITSTRNEEMIKRFINTMKGVANSISKQAYYPNESNFMCSENRCGYWYECHSTF